jgi:Fe-S-cluster containining protein
MTEIDRKAPCPCGSGKKYKSCCYARDRALADARSTARAGHAAIDEVLRVFLPLVESRGEHRIACGEGCNACCANFVRASAAEALLVADWLARPESAGIRARFEARLPAWRERAGDEGRALERLLAENGGTPPEGPAFEGYKALGLDYARKGNLCPFNEAGRCEIYPVRPTICRAVHVVDTADYCTPDRGGVPAVVSHPALEQAVRAATLGFARASQAIGAGADERALPEAIAAALTRR